MSNCSTFEICGVNFRYEKIGTINFIVNNSSTPLIINNINNTAFSLQGILNGGDDVISSNSFIEIAKADYSNSIKYFLKGGPTTDPKSIEIKNNVNSDQILNLSLLPVDLNVLQPLNTSKLTRLNSCGTSSYDLKFNYIIKKPLDLNVDELRLIRIKIELVGSNCGISQYIEIICYFKTFESLPPPTPTSTNPVYVPQSTGSAIYEYRGQDLEILETGNLTIEFIKEGEESTLTSSGTDSINKTYSLSIAKGDQKINLPFTQSSIIEYKKDISSKILNKEFTLKTNIRLNNQDFFFKDILKECKQECLLEEDGEFDLVTNKKYRYVAFAHILSEPDGNALGYLIYYNTLNNTNRWEIARIIAISNLENPNTPFKIVPFLRNYSYESSQKGFPIKEWGIIQLNQDWVDYASRFDLNFNFTALEKEPGIEYMKFFPTSLIFDDIYENNEHNFIENNNFSLALVLPPGISGHLENFYAKLQVSIPNKDLHSEEKLIELSQIYNTTINKMIFSMKNTFPNFSIEGIDVEDAILAKITLVLKSNLTSVFDLDSNEWIVEKEYKKINNDFINGYKVFQIGTGSYKIIKNSKLYTIRLLKKKVCDCWDLFPENRIAPINEDYTIKYDYKFSSKFVYSHGDEKYWRGPIDNPCNCCTDNEHLITNKRCLNFNQKIRCTYCYCPPDICTRNSNGMCPGCCSTEECRPRTEPAHPFTIIDSAQNQGCCSDGGKLTPKIEYFRDYESVKLMFNSNLCPSKKQQCARSIEEISRYLKENREIYPESIFGKYGCFAGEYTCNNGVYVTLMGSSKCDDGCAWFLNGNIPLSSGTYCLKPGETLQGKLIDSVGGCAYAPGGGLTAYACGQSVQSKEFCMGCKSGGPCPGAKETGPSTPSNREYILASFTVPEICKGECRTH